MIDEKITKIVQENSKLLNIIRCYGSVDRNLLCNIMGLSWPTIQKSIEQLKEVDVISNRVGKNEAQEAKKEEFLINPNVGYYIGISVGGSQMKVCIMDMAFKILEQKQFFDEMIDKYGLFQDKGRKIKRCKRESVYGYIYMNTPTDFLELQDVLNYVLDEVIKLSEKVRLENAVIFGVGFAFTGAINNHKKEIMKAYNLECFNILPMQYDSLIYPEKIAYFTSNNIHITFDNIAKAAIVSEKYALYDLENPNSVYRNRRNIGCIYLGSGLGSAFVLDNRLYRGTSNFSEVGHIDVGDPDELLEKRSGEMVDAGLCTCGGKNCLEHKIRTNVFEMTSKEFRSYSASELKAKFYEKKDAEIRLQILAYYINQAIKISTNILNLDLIILTGKITQFMDELGRYLYNEKANNPISYTNADCSLVTSTYGALAPAAGAAILSAFRDGVEGIIWY